ncbi:unnamed protein product (macronuclear) [Paramecium tetraurelia]|uniref:RING-type domain-containing protein n=1 Tax=Paramecium tetraurelia TaxID=5888 RepID=A0C9V2_PARTE|nr:uncharacterized protein GSPATT00006876001 [Paramecium tetraurelia]CAK67569.1 unnamed protein product [Paramecium tetraurelia]|eukprot:XP_001434966.1 hypothetical protein (macronuclear) [Paramecium tetraurelia strain d4-2]
MQEQLDRVKLQLETEVKQLALEFVREQYLEIFLYLYVYFLISFYLENILSIIQIVICLIFIDICNICNFYNRPMCLNLLLLTNRIKGVLLFRIIYICFNETMFYFDFLFDVNTVSIINVDPKIAYLLQQKKILRICCILIVRIAQRMSQQFNVLWKIVILVETLSITLKLDNFVAWDWIQVLWLFLILLILNGVITFVSVLYFAIKVIPDLIKKTEKQKNAYYMQFVLYQTTILLTNLFLYLNLFALIIILPILFVFLTSFTYMKKKDLEQYYANFIFNLEMGKDLEEKQQPYEQPTILQRVSTNYYKPIITNMGQRQSSQPPMLSNDLQSVNSEESNLCIICQDRIGEKIFMPCGHGKFCAQCIGNTEACFLCRIEIAQVLTVQQEHVSFGIVAK